MKGRTIGHADSAMSRLIALWIACKFKENRNRSKSPQSAKEALGRPLKKKRTL